ncbi:MAG: 50S ribosomal protein L18 [Candidatus Kapabacteria bacterium]|nr:50S ribosomal protein L18 [Candidatus Kapabacteria bacterium]
MSRVNKNDRRIRRAKGIRYSIHGTADKPRLSIYRSLNHIYAQIIDDDAKCTLVSASSNDKELKGASSSKTEASKSVGALLAKRAAAANINQVAFDRNGFLYHGRVKALADGAREAGLTI